MQDEPINLLIVVPSNNEAHPVALSLAHSPVARFELKYVEHIEAAEHHLQTNRTDVVLVDLPARDSREMLARLKAGAPGVPIVVLADNEDEVAALEAVREGAQDHFVKSKVNADTLAHGLRYAIERKHAEESLQKSQAFYHSLVESPPQSIFRKDLNGRFTFANGRFCAEIGKTPNEIVGKTDYDFFPGKLAEKYRADDRQVIESGKSFDVVEQHVTPAGDTLYVQVIKSPVYNSSGKLIGTQGIFWDVTEKYRAEEDLRRANADLAQAQRHLVQAAKMESVGCLAAGIAHEVKNPLAIISMGLEYLDDACQSGKLDAEVLRAMGEAVARADSIVRGLVDFSADRELDVAPQSLNAMTRRALLLVKYELNGGHVTVDLDLSPDLPQIRLDPTKIQQVFINLFMNAIHAMSTGGTLTVRTCLRPIHSTEAPGIADRFQRGEPAAVTEVDDTGSGIPPEKLAKVWDPFFTTKGVGRGTGLGLTVTRKIIELHGGAITIGNRPEGGTRVTLLLQPDGKASP